MRVSSREAAVTALGPDVVWLSDRSLALAGGELLIFCEVQGPASWSGAGSHLHSSTSIRCVLDVAVVWQRDWTRVPTRLYLGRANTWFDVGPVHVGSYRNEVDGRTRELEVGWDEPLGPDAWLALGGYPQWLGSIDGDEVRFAGADPVFLAAVDERDRAEIVVTRRAGDSLTVLVNHDWGLVMYLRFDGDAGMHAVTPGATGTTSYRLSNGQVDEHSRADGVARGEALRALREYLATGRAAPWLAWVDD